jgi:hypothetical protein
MNRISANASVNSMSIGNLAIVFGPTLFGLSVGGAADANLQNQVRDKDAFSLFVELTYVFSATGNRDDPTALYGYFR